MHKELSWGNLSGNVHLKDRGDGRVSLRRILAKQDARMWSERNWPWFVANGELWY